MAEDKNICIRRHKSIYTVVAVPTQPTTSHSVTQTAVNIDVIRQANDFFVSKYCVTFTKLLPSGMNGLPISSTTMCSSNNSVILVPLEGESEYEYSAYVIDTAGIICPASLNATVKTLPQSKFF